MKILFRGECIGKVLTNRSLSLEEAVQSAFGYDVGDPEDRKRAYEDDFIAAYLDDNGYCQIDTENMDIVA